MYVRAGLVSLGLLLLSRLLGLMRESTQAAAFGATGLGDAVIVMFTLPDLLVGVLVSGALSYVLLPFWAQHGPQTVQRSQRQVAGSVLAVGILLGMLIWLMRGAMSHLLAPGLQADMASLGASSLAWSAAVLPLAMLAALWTTRLQHERDFVGMYAASLLVNLLLVAALALIAINGMTAYTAGGSIFVLGCSLVLAMLARLSWLYWRLSKGLRLQRPAPLLGGMKVDLPKATVWLWAALSSGMLLLLPVVGRSLASLSGEGALATFNYAWKLIELPLVLAIQLVASLAFPVITRTRDGSPERAEALRLSFMLAWSLACAAIAVVGAFSLPLAKLLFGWGRMGADDLLVVAEWGAAGVWSLLPQALIAVVLTVMAISQQMHVAVWAYAAGIGVLVMVGWWGAASGLASGLAVMWLLNMVLTGVALCLLFSQRRSVAGSVPVLPMLAPLAMGSVLVLSKPWLPAWGLAGSATLAGCFALLVMASALAASPHLRRAALHWRSRPALEADLTSD